MAVSEAESQANRQELYNMGMDDSMIQQYATDLGINIGPKVNPTEKLNISNAFKGSNAYKSSNIAGAVSGTPNDGDDLAGMRNTILSEFNIPGQEQEYQTGLAGLADMPNQIETELGIPVVQQQFNDMVNQIRGLSVEFENQISGTEDLPIIMNKIRGIQDKIARKGESAIKTLTVSAQAVGDQLTSLKEQADKRYQKEERRLDAMRSQLMMSKEEAEAQYGIRASEIQWRRELMIENADAGITLGDSTEVMARKIQESNDRQFITELQVQYPFARLDEGMDFDEAMDKIRKAVDKENVKETARQVLGYVPKGSKREIQKKIKSYLKDEEEYIKEKRELEFEDIRSSIEARKKAGSGKDTDEEKSIKEAYSDADRLRGQMNDDKADWNYAFNYMKNKYPQADDATIDEMLGYDMSEKFNQ